jgi:aspartyl-tRNA(Asn)/glutamyl-tRNA(Gln) amidotransferase subunit C
VSDIYTDLVIPGLDLAIQADERSDPHEGPHFSHTPVERANQLMKLSREEVEHIAELAKVGLTEEEKALFQEQLSAILEYAEMLQRVDTAAIPPTATVLPLRNVMRLDEVRPSLPREDVLANAPQSEDGCFRVKVILE